MAGNASQYVDVTAPAVDGYSAVGVISLGHDDVANMSFRKWSVEGGVLRAMVHNETSGQRSVTVFATFLYL